MSNIIDVAWDTKPQNIMENLRAVAEAAQRQTGFTYQQFHVSGRTLIAYYRAGHLSPSDDTLKILVPSADRKIVQRYFRKLGKKVPAHIKFVIGLHDLRGKA